MDVSFTVKDGGNYDSNLRPLPPHNHAFGEDCDTDCPRNALSEPPLIPINNPKALTPAVMVTPERTQIDGHHYTDLAVQPIDLIGAAELDFCSGSVVKHVVRAGHKGEALKDLLKARHYLDMLIAREKGDPNWTKAQAQQ